jgi:hypothetical protein
MEDKLLEALKAVKNECEQHRVCKECPIRVKNIDNDEYMCYLRTKNPLNWRFKEEIPPEVPRIFGD